MKANELMIGNWVYSTFSELPCKITYLKLHESGYGSVETTNVEGVKDIESLSPVPLTPEILEKNGFVYFHKNFASLSYEHPFKLEMVEWPDENGLGGLWTVCNIIKIQFVHELQHALRICGIEKEIEL